MGRPFWTAAATLLNKMEDDSAPPRLKTNVEEKIVLKVKD